MKRNTIIPYVTRYLNSVRSAGRSRNTVETYGRILKNTTDIMCEKYDMSTIEDIKGYMVEDAIQSMENISVKTRNYYISAIQLFFKYLQESGYIERDPSSVLKKTKVIVDDSPVEDDMDNRAYTEKNLLSILSVCDGTFKNRDRAIIAMLSGSGLRASELCSLNIGDWKNISDGHIYVRRKGGAYRWVAVAEYVKAYVDKYLDEREGVSDTSPLFVTSGGKRIVRQELYRILKRRQDAANVKTGVHIFRHTFLTGTSKVSNVKVAQALANHSSSSTTKKYIHSTSDERKQAVNNTSWAEKMGELA